MEKKNIVIPRLQFYWRLKSSSNDENIVPDFLPFESSYDETLALLTQRRNKNVLSSLKKIYKEEPNIGHNQEISNWSSFYGKDFMQFIEGALSKNRKNIKKILEIGCGGCLLLEAFKKKGYEAIGIDPSSFALKEGRKRGIKVVRDFFPSKRIKGKFDLIFHSNVLEHAVSPVGFLKSQYRHLNDGGLVILAVPDCNRTILNGDISMFYHQHLSYFDDESLKNTLSAAGFKDVKIEKANWGGNLYSAAKKNDVAKKSKKGLEYYKGNKYKNFLKNYRATSLSVVNFIKSILKEKGKTLGFYAPLRSLPYTALMNLQSGFRFFDDTSYWHRSYFDGINVLIENFEDLKKNPVTDLFVMSATFEDLIEQKVVKFFGKEIRIKKLTDFYIQK